ncbi:hypothetical protein JMJ35_003347 [Cladonia borealis]|uniref:Uncharacterized protein n=1 Tax=Cladonia borealis TaxID=184061 RepID=A0AA39R6J5_9LECA|nr:hypothetical protein JMJ35_003347 [Cladonia borealis]
MATVSRQSAFWAVVALGLNTFTQDGGKVLGFPAEYSRALRLSPMVCIVDTLGVLFTVAFFCYKTRSFKDGLTLAARYRRLTEENPAEPKLERTWWFRFSVFALGALPQAVKILGMGGIPVTKIWGMAYLVSFLVLEGLDLLRPRQRRDYHALEPYATVLDTYIWLPGYLAVLTQHAWFLLHLFLIPSKLDSECNLVLGSYPLEFGRTTRAFLIVGTMAWNALAMLTFFVMVHLLVDKLTIHTSLLGALVEGIQIVLWNHICAYPVVLISLYVFITPKCAFSPDSLHLMAINSLLTSIPLPFLLNEMAYEDRWFRRYPFLMRWFRKIFALNRSERGNRNFPLLFTALSVTNIIYYYMYVYNPSITYKPPWTEYLG